MRTTLPSVAVTGAAGFIGFSLSRNLLHQGYHVLGIDNFYNNYPVLFKKDNIKYLQKYPHFNFSYVDILRVKDLEKLFDKYHPVYVFHLAALTGVRTSLNNPSQYYRVNVDGTRVVYEVAANHNVKAFVFTSSSSVYGNAETVPFSEELPLEPHSPYAETKKEAEKILSVMHQKRAVPTQILRLFSVYGPHGRPDMAPYLFTEAAFKSKPIFMFGDGTSSRDFTYIDDVVDAIIKSIKLASTWNIINVGNSSPITLTNLITLIEQETGGKIRIQAAPANPAESRATYADITKARALLSWHPKTSFKEGMRQFINWYQKHRL